MSEKLAEMEALLAKATPEQEDEPWHRMTGIAPDGTTLCAVGTGLTFIARFTREEDADLLIWLKDNAPALLRSQAERVKELEGALAALVSFDPGKAGEWTKLDVTLADVRRARSALHPAAGEENV